MRLVRTAVCCVLLSAALSAAIVPPPEGFESVVGDPGMTQPPRVLWEGWNMCNRAGRNCTIAPRWADCITDGNGPGPNGNQVTPKDNARGLPADSTEEQCDPFTEQKERDLGALCATPSPGTNGSFFWTAMLKSGNFDTWEEMGLCGQWCKEDHCANSVENALRFNNLPMNQPYVSQQWSSKDSDGHWRGSFYGTWDPNTPIQPPAEHGSEKLPADICDMRGIWHGNLNPTPVNIFSQQGGNFNASCAAWSNQRSGTVDAQGNIHFFDSATSTFVGKVVAFNKSSPACSLIEWSTPSNQNWCRNSVCGGPQPSTSYVSLDWFWRNNSMVYRNRLKTSPNYPWLMLYFGADAATGRKGGYPWDGRGMMLRNPTASPRNVPSSSNDFYTRYFFNLTAWQHTSSFYFLNIAACWKMNGSDCNGDITSDVTRYILLDLHQSSKDSLTRCGPAALHHCPEHHIFANGSLIRREEPGFPHEAYITTSAGLRYERKVALSKGLPPPPQPMLGFDPYSNPQRQDFIKLAPCKEWAQYGFPETVQEAVDKKYWVVNVGQATARVKLDGAEPAMRHFHTLNVGPEMGLGSSASAEGLWEVSQFDVWAPKQ